MVSIGSLPPLLDPSKGHSPALLRSRALLWSQTPLDRNGGGCKVKLGRRLLVGSGSSGGVRGKGPRATQASGGLEGEDEDDEGVADEALRATIKQSRKVLALQRSLLQQIVERRKLTSPMQSNGVSTELDTISYDGGDSSMSNLDQSSTNGYSQSTEAEFSRDPPVGGNIINREMKPINDSQVEHTLATALGLSREATLEADQSKIISPFLSEVSESFGVKDEKIEELTEASVDIPSAEYDAAPSPPLAGENVMNVILISAECAPWSKTGGLGDVAGALPKALARRGHRVMVVSPRYGNYGEPLKNAVIKRYKVDGQDMEVSYYHAYVDGVDFVFLESANFRNREKDIYGGNRMDNLKRMILLCKAAVEVPYHVPCGGICYGDGNLVIIANDWHTALVPVYIRAYYRDHGLMKYVRCVLVIHNIAYQGRGPLEDFAILNLPGHYMELFKLYDPVGGEHLNIFAAGLKSADRVVTVSDGYARELKTLEGGWGLHGVINENDWKFHGIVNGIDTREWNPELDAHLKSDGYANYSLDTLKTGKPLCKVALQRELGLEIRDNVPVLGFIGRLDHQKGIDLIAEAIHWIIGQDVQLVMLGSGRSELEETLKRLQSEHHSKVRGWVGFSVGLAHRITAGADILLMPSRFEPCGLNQLYAMMYGTVPVVHAVGGLRDTVHQYDPFNEIGLGWTFEKAEANRLIDALANCLKTYKNYKDSWEGLQRRGMMQDLSWDIAAQRYEDVLVAAKYQW